MRRQSLRRLGVDPGALLAVAGIAETRRAEEVDTAGFIELARAFRTLSVRPVRRD